MFNNPKHTIKMATLIKTTGEQTAVTPKNGKYFTLDELMTLVGGPVGVVYLDDMTKTMVAAENGKARGLALNQSATALAKPSTVYGDAVVGDGYEIPIDC
jgi:hypothetical protein